MPDPHISPDGNWVWDGSEWKPFTPTDLPAATSPPSTSDNPKLVVCPDCGTEISKRAHSCPKCGAPREKSPQTVEPYPSADDKWRALIILILGILFFAIYYLFLGLSYGLSGLYMSSPIFSAALVVSGAYMIKYLKLVSAWEIRNGIDNSTSVIGIYIILFSIVIPSLFYTPLPIIYSLFL